MERSGRQLTPDEHTVLGAWSGWGAVPNIFDEQDTSWDGERQRLRSLIGADEYAQARRTTINAHYTDPAYVTAIWAALEDLGFPGGRVLEPGSGSGTFIGLAPSSAHMTGIELDSISARLSQVLYPDAAIRHESFTETPFRTGHFDATVGNVPFGNVQLHDRIDNASGHSIHNHFILKALRLTRPGGVVAVLTSRYTLDARNPAARVEMSTYGDLVGAVRLPAGAHNRTAGTDVVTDLLIFHRRDPGTPPADTTWEHVTPVQIGDTSVPVNSYFAAHPEHILGKLSIGRSQYASESLTVTHPDLTALPGDLRHTLRQITDAAVTNGQGFSTAPEITELAVDGSNVAEVSGVTAAEHDRALVELDRWDGTVRALPDGTFITTRVQTEPEPLTVPKTHRDELRHLLELRDLLVRQMSFENATLDTTPDMDSNRAALRGRWQEYVDTYGPINRFKAHNTGKLDEDGDPIVRRTIPTAVRVLRHDPHGMLVTALEVFDEASGRATPAGILQQRMIVPRPEPEGADTALEAVQYSLNRLGRLDLDYTATLLGMTPSEARSAIGDLAYDEPHTGALVPAAEYLSGDIYTKLETARAAAETNETYAINVTALEQVLPAPITPVDITARPGAVWIPADIHEQFLQELLRDRGVTVRNPLPAKWEVTGGDRRSTRAASTWGTQRRPAQDLFKSLASQAPITVKNKVDDADGREREVLSAEETTAAQQKADELAQRFGEWVWEDYDRATALAAEYNRRFNTIALRDYTTEGNHLTFPGLAEMTRLEPHQRAAVARIVSEPATGLFHEVGAGKTLQMVAGAMELRRMGLASKIAVVVPNHMLEQFAREWIHAYPQARLLAPTIEDLRADRRRQFVAKAVTNDWDGIILTRTAFKLLPVSPETERSFIQTEADRLRQSLLHTQDPRSIKDIEKAIERLENKQKKLLDTKRDPGITFEATGIDYLMVDEMHDYKNLDTISAIPDAKIDGSDRSTDLMMKLNYLRATHGERVVTAATATPIANSVTEAHVMQRFLRPDLLEAAGVEHFDSWAATFGQQVTSIEVSPQGGGAFRLKTRFAKFQNVPEMLRMWHTFADVKTAEDLNLPVPALAARPDGTRAPNIVPIDADPGVLDYIKHLGHRADKVAARQVPPNEDNMLAICTDARKASIDLRMVAPTATPISSPLTTVADTIARIHFENDTNTYIDTRTGEMSPTPGALQLVFCDLGTPDDDKWNPYHELRRLLVERGLDRTKVRFIHEAATDQAKDHLFESARQGGVSVLIGSTQKMGVGTNIQHRAIALHDIDCPWRPADIKQRHGRILRRGNQNPEVSIHQYVVTGTFAAYMWQSIERKDRFISQVMRGNLHSRELDDIASSTLSAAEAKAIASGNPLLLERTEAQATLSKLQRLQRAHTRNHDLLETTVRATTSRIAQLTANIAALTQAKPRIVDLSGDNFQATINRAHHTTRADAAAALEQWARTRSLEHVSSTSPMHYRAVGEISSFPITAYGYRDVGTLMVTFEFDGLPGADVRVPASALRDTPAGVITRLENAVARVETLIARQHETIAQLEQERHDAQAHVDDPFKHADALRDAREHLAAIDRQIEIDTVDADTTPAAPDPGSPTQANETQPRTTMADQATGPHVPLGAGSPASSGVRLG